MSAPDLNDLVGRAELAQGDDVMTDLRVLDLFSGIGGFSLGLERAGMRTVAFCERDGYARRVLRKHWPDVWLYDDIRTLTKKRLKADGIDPNVICGGFPCQDISTAGKGAGIDGARSGLWSEMFRLVREVKPLWVIAENVPALRCRGADRVLADLEGAGYTAEPAVVGAWNVGAPHQRERVWIVAHSAKPSAREALSKKDVSAQPRRSIGASSVLADTDCERFGRSAEQQCPGEAVLGRPSLADAPGARCKARRADRLGKDQSHSDPPAQRGWWQVEPPVGRVADGIPGRVDRLRCLGNAVIPLIPELIGQFVIESETILSDSEKVIA